MKKYLLIGIVILNLFFGAGCSTNLRNNIGKMYKKIATPYIANVDKNSNAFIKGLRPGDIIIKIDGKSINKTADIYKEEDYYNVGVTDITCRRKFTTFRVTLRKGLAGISFQEQNYPSTLGFALYDIANAINRKLPYEYAAALAGDIFSPFVKEGKCVKEWQNALGEQSLEFAVRAMGLKLKVIYSLSDSLYGKDSENIFNPENLKIMKDFLRDQGIIIIHGGFRAPLTWNWGIVDSIRHDTLLAYTVGGGGIRVPIVHPPISAFLVQYAGGGVPLDSINIHIIRQIIMLYSGKQGLNGWKTGFEAYRYLEGIDNYNKFKRCMIRECNYKRFWQILKLNRRSENAFLYYSDMSKNKKLKPYLGKIMQINNMIINSRTPSFIGKKNTIQIYNYLNYIKKIAKLDSARIDLYKKILIFY